MSILMHVKINKCNGEQKVCIVDLEHMDECYGVSHQCGGLVFWCNSLIIVVMVA